MSLTGKKISNRISLFSDSDAETCWISTTLFSYEGQNLNVEPQRQNKHPEVSTHRSEKWLLDLLGEDMEHVHGFCRQGEIGA